MADLVPIPYQPECWVTPKLLALLAKACQHAGHNIPINGSDGAWRAYAQQKAFWDAYQAYLNGAGPYATLASNPDTGQRNHMRGEAVDIFNRSDRDAMLAVGFIPDEVEWWHFNEPGWANMPIIPTNTSVADSGTAIPLGGKPLTPEEHAMLQAIWTWMGGGQNATEFYKMQQQLARIMAATDQLATGQGPVHVKLDQLLYVTNDAGVGIRQRVAAAQTALAQLEAEVTQLVPALPTAPKA